MIQNKVSSNPIKKWTGVIEAGNWFSHTNYIKIVKKIGDKFQVEDEEGVSEETEAKNLSFFNSALNFNNEVFVNQ